MPYSKAGVWSVRAVFRNTGPFDHCSANARYKSGTRISIIAYTSGNWRLWFSHPSWPDRGNAAFPARLEVDGRTVLQRNGKFKGRNAFIDLGRDIEKVKALMRGRRMSVVTPSGTSRFSLKGTFRATVEVARCWKANRQAPGAGAFGSANSGSANSGSGGAFGGGAGTGGAFGGGTAPNQAPKRKVNELSRANTLEIATQYLAKAQQPYSILPANKNTLRHFPVNWKYRDGSFGGMRVFQNTSVAVENLLTTLLADQAKYCDGRNASQREGVRTVAGRRMIRARGVCQTAKGTVLNITYRVAELGRQLVMMIMEVKTAAGGAPSPGAPSPGASPPAAGSPIRVPGPQEL